jgi:hypothetical protein
MSKSSSAKLFIVFFLLLFLGGCVTTSKTHEDKMFAYFDDRIISSDATFIKSLHDSFPFGDIVAMHFYDSKIFLLDESKNCIHVMDSDGRLLHRFGVVGNGSGEMMNPSAFFLENDEIYVAETGNRRIQIFDLDGISKGIISLRSIPEFAQYLSIGKVKEGYLLSVSTRESYPTAYFIKDDGTSIELSKQTIGLIAAIKDEAFYIESGEHKKIDEGFNFSTGENSVFRWNENDKSLVKQAVSYPYGFSIRPNAYSIGKNWYALSFSFASIDKFDENWNYLETVINLQEETELTSTELFRSVFAMSDDGSIFMYVPDVDQLYAFTPTHTQRQ